MCDAVLTALGELARRHPAASFVSVAAATMMPAEQLHLLPAVFCYCGGALKERLISRQLADPGVAPTPDELEWKLAGLGVLDSDLEEPLPHSSGQQRRLSQRPSARRTNEEDPEDKVVEDDNDLDCNLDDGKEEKSEALGVD
jgi:hypothetical protein